MGKIGIVYNPHAGSNKHYPERKQNLEKILGSHGVIRETSCIEEIYQVAREFRDMGIEILGISGGDGTNQCVLTSFCEVYGEQELPAVVLLRGGTMNLREASMKMKGSPENRLKKLINRIEHDNLDHIPHTLLCVNGKYGCIFGNGLVANFMQEYYQGGNPGFYKALTLLIKTVYSGITRKNFASRIFSPIKATVEVEGKTLPQENFVALLAATTRECGLGFKPFYRAGEKSGHLHFLAVNLSPLELIKNLHLVRSGKKIPSERIHDYLTKEVVINTAEHYYYTVDGEMLNSTKQIRITAGPTVNLAVI